VNTRGLLLSKAVLEEGEAALRSQGPFSPSIGLLLLHDAVECALHAAASQAGSASVKVGPFMDYWKAIPDLPLRTEMDRMNRARVDLKHHMNTPDKDDVNEHFRNARALLRAIASKFYSVEFDALSEVTIVTDSAVRARLEAAERSNRADRIGEALTECAHARSLMLEQQRDLFSQSWLVSAGLEPGMPPAADKRIRAEVAHLHQEIRELSGVVFAQTFGLNLMDYRLLRSILPTIRGTEVTFSAGVPDGISQKMVRRCIQLLARYAIRLDRELSAAKHPSWNE
jgi:hypothetical protein